MYLNGMYVKYKENKYICLINTLRTGDADLRFYVTTAQDG